MLYWVRTCLVVAFPFVIVWVYFSRLFREIEHGFWFAKNDVKLEVASFREIWRRGS